MNRMYSLLAIVFASAVSCSVFAADVPQDVIGSDEFNQEQCINDNTQNCINDACLTSEATDCQENCQTMAQEKCAELSNE